MNKSIRSRTRWGEKLIIGHLGRSIMRRVGTSANRAGSPQQRKEMLSMPQPIIPISAGERFGQLTALSLSHRRRYRNRWVYYWLCQCDCGQIAIINRNSLRRGFTQSCGCRRRNRFRTHGWRRTPEYAAWTRMKNRCYNVKDRRYADWGGRGIRVCLKWRKSFPAFLTDVGRRPSPQHSIDRINNDGDYEPDNVRWATRIEQARNCRLRAPQERSPTTGRFIRRSAGAAS